MGQHRTSWTCPVCLGVECGTSSDQRRATFIEGDVGETPQLGNGRAKRNKQVGGYNVYMITDKGLINVNVDLDARIVMTRQALPLVISQTSTLAVRTQTLNNL